MAIMSQISVPLKRMITWRLETLGWLLKLINLSSVQAYLLYLFRNPVPVRDISIPLNLFLLWILCQVSAISCCSLATITPSWPEKCSPLSSRKVNNETTTNNLNISWLIGLWLLWQTLLGHWFDLGLIQTKTKAKFTDVGHFGVFWDTD